MPSLEQQKGLTAISIAMILAVVGFAIFLIFKLAPPYIEAYSVQDSLNSLKKDLEIREKSKEEIYTLLRKRFEINDITSVKKENITIKKSGQILHIQVDYEVRVPIVGNIDLALTFDQSIDL
jgi:hypothetical protein